MATLQLSDRAYHKLIEEYPLAKPYTRKENQSWLFEATVQDVRGIGRFILGMAGEAEVPMSSFNCFGRELKMEFRTILCFYNQERRCYFLI